MKYNEIWKIGKKLYMRFVKDDISALGAQVAYYLILSFFPFLVFLVTLLSYTNIIGTDFLSMVSAFIPNSVYMLILDIENNVYRTRNKAFISLGMIATIWSASSGVNAFMYGMNKAYKKKETRPFWKVRALSVIFTLALSTILFCSIVLIVFGETLGKHLSEILMHGNSFDLLWNMLRYAISLVAIFIVFILFYMYTPNDNLHVKEVLPGAVLSTIALITLSAGFAFYIDNFSNLSKTYGSIGAAIALLIWLYWSSVIIFMGSELNALLYRKHK